MAAECYFGLMPHYPRGHIDFFYNPSVAESAKILQLEEEIDKLKKRVSDLESK